MKKYFLFSNGFNAGPYSFEELRMMNISPNTPVWFDGLENWRNANQIPELQSLFNSNPQPFYQQSSGYIPPAYGSNPNYSQPNYTQPDYSQLNFNYQVPPKDDSAKKTAIILGSIFFVLLLSAVFVIFSARQKRRESATSMRMYDSLMMQQTQAMADSMNAIVTTTSYAGNYYNYSGGTLKIDENLEVTLHFQSTTGTKCSGDIKGTGTINGSEIVVTTTDGCQITLEKSSNNDIVISESEGCRSYHGENCNFGGTYFRQ